MVANSIPKAKTKLKSQKKNIEKEQFLKIKLIK